MTGPRNRDLKAYHEVEIEITEGPRVAQEVKVLLTTPDSHAPSMISYGTRREPYEVDLQVALTSTYVLWCMHIHIITYIHLIYPIMYQACSTVRK